MNKYEIKKSRYNRLDILKRQKKLSGLVIVTVLWIVMLLGIIVAMIGRSSRLDAKVSLAHMQGLKLRWACRAGIDTAIAVLGEDSKTSDSLQDLWSDNVTDFNGVFQQCRFQVEVIDEAGKLNINTAAKDQLLTLPEMTHQIAEAIIDWRDKNNTPGPSGVESGYYRSLPYGYEIRNGPFRTIRELLLVKDIDSELLFSRQTRWIDHLTCYSMDNNQDASGQERININKADENKLKKSLKIEQSHAKWIVENRPKNNGYKCISDLINKNTPKKSSRNSGRNSNEAKPLDLETFYEIADKITVTDEKRIPGKININTASRTVLEALLEETREPEKLADDIINNRESLVSGMESIAEIMTIRSIKTDTFKKIAKYITTRSDIYSINCTASIDQQFGSQAKLRTEAIVDRHTNPEKIIYWYQGTSN